MTEAAERFQIVNVLGLHARAASKLTQLAARYRAEITLEKDGQSANAKSIMGVLLLCGSCGSYVDVRARGEDADDAVAAIGRLIAERFGEDQ